MYAEWDGKHPEATGLVPPGKTHTSYMASAKGSWPSDRKTAGSIAWLYHSHYYEPKDVNAGLMERL
jgi:hypothetical protein